MGKIVWSPKKEHILSSQMWDFMLTVNEKHNIQLKTLVNKYIACQTQFPIKISPKMAFIILFSFEHFHYMHKCLGYLLKNEPINEEYFQTFVSFIQKK